MMKNLFLLFSFLGSMFVNAQIFQEDFDGNGPGISAWITLDLDGLTPHPNVGFITNGWNRIDRYGAHGNFGGPPGNYAAMSTSWYNPIGTSNDWLISPQIDLSNAVHPILTFDIKAQDPEYPDGYILRLSPTGSAEPDDFTVILGQSTAAPGDWTKLTFDLINHISPTIRFALINNTTDKFMLLADNFLIDEKIDDDGGNGLDYCGSLVFSSTVEVMTQVNFSNLSQSTPLTNTEPHIMYLDKIANVTPGESYDIVLKGDTKGSFNNRFAVFIDWNQDGVFSGDDEIIQVTELIFGSTGQDDIKATHTIVVPENAKPGPTRMRIKKIFGVTNYLDPCLGTQFGQAHDYTVNVGGLVSYCTPNLDCTDGDIITHVVFSGIDNASSCGENGYSDYTNLEPALVGTGYDVPIAVTVGGGFLAESVSVWIDYNNNGVFEENEFTYIGTGSNSIIKGVVQVPTSVSDGTYRMRVRVAAVGAQLATWDQSCEDERGFGETEDYLVTVRNGYEPEPEEPLCEQSIPSNNLQSGYYFGGNLNQRLAVDILVQKPEGLRIDKIDFNQASEATRYKLHFYTSGSDGLPADLIQTVETTFIDKTLIGTNFGHPFYVTSLQLNTPIHLPLVNDGVYYWMEIETDAFAWETTTNDVIGKLMAFNNNNSNSEWEEAEHEGVYAIYGECENLSVREIIKADALVYPNPVRDKLTVEATKSIRQVELYNLAGQQVLNNRVKMEDNKTKAVVYLAHLPTGVYILKAEIDGEVKTFKVIKK